MRTGRPALPHALFLALVAAATTLAALLSWRVFIVGKGQYLIPLVICGVLIAVTGALLRHAGLPRLVVLPVQALVAAAYVCGHIAGSALPTHDNLVAIGHALSGAMNSAQTYQAPIGPSAPSVAPLLIVCGAGFLLLVDLLACTLRRVPIAGLPLLAIYSVPAGLTESGPGALAFLGAAIGFLVLLHVDARDDLLRWGRPLGPTESSPWTDANPVADAVRAGAGRIGVAATALALVVPVFVPVLHLDVFGLGPGSGSGDITIHHPQTDMRRDLEQGEDQQLLRITTDDPNPDYLRIAVLNWFTGDEWTSGDRDVSSNQRADGAPLPPPQGLAADVPRETYDYRVSVSDSFNSYWLPTIYPATKVLSSDDWRYDPDSMDFISADDDLTTAGENYSFTAIRPDYGTTGAFFRDSVSGDVPSTLTDLPDGLPSSVAQYALEATNGASSDYEKAVLLQRWFRDNFTYSVEDAPQGTGGGTFATFLNKGPDGRIGYCEQFASAMAVMARTLGIPARVAVGFYEPDRVGPGVFAYSTHDLHAWPELYFEGAGWVRFEPTPADRAKTVPSYTRARIDRSDPATDPNAPKHVNELLGDTPHGADTPTTAADPETTTARERAGSGQSTSTTVMLVVFGLVLLLLVAAGLPRVVRGRLRARRLAGAPEDVWAELAATAVDLQVPWPTGRSPREIAAVLVEHMAGHGEALNRLVARIELTRYARPGSAVSEPSEELRADGEACVTALTTAALPKVRRRGAWLPRSLWRSADRVDDRLPLPVRS
ncbi:DUF3488 and transglutaminase-like domain-containing protein [Nocardioides panacisoli]|uniref:DUF3488 and transglutaminase-like domain-containing protein n=1 Tax=Nocardioides panacisoli TaxID=627624 RepID=A0ABP7I913_9ACTN